MKKTIFIIFCLAMTACGNNGGGSGSFASSSIPQVITYPKANCGSKNCVSGASVSNYKLNAKNSGVSALTGGTGHFDQVGIAYSNIEGRLNEVKTLIEIINMVADDEGITSCDQIPTSVIRTHHTNAVLTRIELEY